MRVLIVLSMSLFCLQSFGNSNFQEKVNACKALAEYAGKIELGQDINFLKAEASLYPSQMDFSLNANEARYQVLVTEEKGATYVYAATVALPNNNTYECKVVSIESITGE